MIGLALVTLVATLAAGIINPFTSAVNDIFHRDYSITAQNNFDPIPISRRAQAAAKAPGVIAVASVRTGDGPVFGKTIFATAVDPGSDEVITLDWVKRLPADVANLGPTALRRRRLCEATRAHDRVADRDDVPQRDQEAVRIKGSSTRRPGGTPFGAVTISAATWDANNSEPKNLYSFVKMTGGEYRREPRPP